MLPAGGDVCVKALLRLSEGSRRLLEASECKRGERVCYLLEAMSLSEPYESLKRALREP